MHTYLLARWILAKRPKGSWYHLLWGGTSPLSDLQRAFLLICNLGGLLNFRNKESAVFYLLSGQGPPCFPLYFAASECRGEPVQLGAYPSPASEPTSRSGEAAPVPFRAATTTTSVASSQPYFLLSLYLHSSLQLQKFMGGMKFWVSVFQDSDVQPPAGSFWTLGNVSIRCFRSVFDRGNTLVGLAPAVP